MYYFIGRDKELGRLEALTTLIGSSVAVIKGRRRVGKSSLARKFGHNKNFFSFSGIAPSNGVTAQQQRDHFSRQFATVFDVDAPLFEDWSEAFRHLSYQLNHKLNVILLDEISWMGSKDPTFIPKLKDWWDEQSLKKNKVILIICGSVSTWIDDNIINNTAMFGRVSLQIDLQELNIAESYELLKKIGLKGSAYDMFKIMAVTGGVPWYLEQINPKITADENIKALCFRESGVLVYEFDRIFNDLFSIKGDIYKRIIYCLSDGMKSQKQIRESIQYQNSGTLSVHLRALVVSGFISQHNNWSINTEQAGKISLYRLKDNYTRFYIKYIEKKLPNILKHTYDEISLNNLPGWKSIMGFQIESLLLKSRNQLLKALDINFSDVVFDNPYIQRKTTRHKGVQVDYLIQTKNKNLFFCEFKFQQKELQMNIIEEVEEKISRLATPKKFGVAPVLVHIGGVSDAVYESNYFYRIIDMEDFLKLSD